MNKERELLRKILATGWLNNTISCEVEELLAQPEQTEQEPVGYLYKQKDCYGKWGIIFKVHKPYITLHEIKDIVPVYTHPPKREPLSDEQIEKLWDITYSLFIPIKIKNFAKAIEKAHGIGE